jgi:hypothetical protein
MPAPPPRSRRRGVVIEDRGEPALRLGDRPAFAAGIVLDPVAPGLDNAPGLDIVKTALVLYDLVMLDQKTIDTIARQVAAANLSSANVTGVFSAPTTDSEGHDALRITIVLTEGSSDVISGKKTLDTLAQLQDSLQKQGEDRFAFIEYATDKEIDESGDPES